MDVIPNSRMKERFDLWAQHRRECCGYSEEDIEDVYAHIKQDISTRDDLLRQDCYHLVDGREQSSEIPDRNDRRRYWYDFLAEGVLTKLGIEPKEIEVKKYSVQEAVGLLMSVKHDGWRDAWFEKAEELFSKGYATKVKNAFKKAMKNVRK